MRIPELLFDPKLQSLIKQDHNKNICLTEENTPFVRKILILVLANVSEINDDPDLERFILHTSPADLLFLMNLHSQKTIGTKK